MSSEHYSQLTPDEYLVEEVGSSFSWENYNETEMDEFATSEYQPSIPIEEDSRSAGGTSSKDSQWFS